MSKVRKAYVQEELTLEDILEAKDIFITYGRDGTFYLNFDNWDVPEKAKIWYKFSINPFDLYFLKIVKIGEGFLDMYKSGYADLDIIFKYLNISSDIYSTRNSILIYHVFFEHDTVKNITNKLHDEIIDDSLGVINTAKVYNLKSKIKNRTKEWFSRIFREYNNNDNSLEYIQEYYNNWVLLVELIQTMKFDEQNILWKFINEYDIHSFTEFCEYWNKVKDGEIKVRGLTKYDIIRISTIIRINTYNLNLKE
jgi:hypothetical protein